MGQVVHPVVPSFRIQAAAILAGEASEWGTYGAEDRVFFREPKYGGLIVEPRRIVDASAYPTHGQDPGSSLGILALRPLMAMKQPRTP